MMAFSPQLWSVAAGLAMRTRLAVNFRQPSCPSLLSAGVQACAPTPGPIIIPVVPNTDMYATGAEQIKEHDRQRKTESQKPRIPDSQSSWAWEFLEFLFYYLFILCV